MSARPWIDGLDLLRAAGATVVPIENFDLQTAWVPQARVLLVAADLTAEQRHETCRVYLAKVMEAAR